MPLEVLHQIKYLCKTIAKVEWSGVLFYTIEGSIKDPETFKIILKTILPLDMGTTGFTGYTLDSRFTDFIEEDFDERCQWKVGTIHSHHCMATFFSNVDMDDLSDNAGGHNFYLSLIVNNYMDFLAKIGFIGEAKQDIKQVPFTALDEDGQSYVIESKDYVIDNRKLYVYNTNIISSVDTIEVPEPFGNQVKKIMEPKPVAKPEKEPFKNWELPSHKKTHKKEVKKTVGHDLEEEDLGERAVRLYNFTFDVLNFYKAATQDDVTIEDVLDIIAEFDLEPAEISKYIMDDFVPKYEVHFPEATPEEFVKDAYTVIEMLEEIQTVYPEIRLTNIVLRRMIEKFVTSERESKSK